MRKIFFAIFTTLFMLSLSVLTWAEDSVTVLVKNSSVAGYEAKIGLAMDNAFIGGVWGSNSGKAVFTGKVKPGSVFPAEEKDSFFDMQYSTIEENQLTGTADIFYKKYIANQSDEIKKKSGYSNKMLLGSEKYYNIMDILDSEATNSNVTVVFSMSKDGKKAEIVTIDAPKLFIHNESIKDFCKFVFKK